MQHRFTFLGLILAKRWVAIHWLQNNVLMTEKWLSGTLKWGTVKERRLHLVCTDDKNVDHDLELKGSMLEDMSDVTLMEEDATDTNRVGGSGHIQIPWLTEEHAGHLAKKIQDEAQRKKVLEMAIGTLKWGTVKERRLHLVCTDDENVDHDLELKGSMLEDMSDVTLMEEDATDTNRVGGSGMSPVTDWTDSVVNK
ncbi:hypothetical protein NDU88_002151 [Pleurodeles waltl]|uniref:Uncharacterized protein n=1 Tax=Pleurodeles waltl TaxID=8319 RepID=A0AAV7M385_PLEWA|nr:hypothetical protein NDU88_002151 [Pleurodeles waltl]